MQEATPDFEIKNLCASVDGKPILRGVNLKINKGETHALMGPNGSGKSTLANVIMGHPAYEVTAGEVLYRGQNLLELETDARARLGIFLAFQYPVAVPGVPVTSFLKQCVYAVRGPGAVKATVFRKRLKENAEYLEIAPEFLDRFLNDGFSGGEKKRMEILQMLMLKPGIAILDETDSGLDIDALQVVSKGINRLVGPGFGSLVITHYERILKYIRPDYLHILLDGRVAFTGGPEWIRELEQKGYDWVREKFGADVLAE